MKEAKEFLSRICTVAEEKEGVFFVFRAASLSLIFAFRCTAEKHPERADLLFSFQLFYDPFIFLPPRSLSPLRVAPPSSQTAGKRGVDIGTTKSLFPDTQYVHWRVNWLAFSFEAYL